jgi:uncharacterized protein YndB with AHSA1/START domain
MNVKAQDKELIITHLFDAPIDVVFEAWTNPEILKLWYAPDRCNIEYKTIEVKKGGRFHYRMHDPLNGEAWVTGTYLEISPPKKLVFTIRLSNENGDMTSGLAAEKLWPGEVLTTVTFEPIGEQTKATIHETVSEQEARETGAYQGWIEMFNKLNQLLSGQLSG